MLNQLKIELQNIQPKIWRRIQVNSDISLNELHHIIQISMGWTNSHLYSFKIDKIEYSLPEYNYDYHTYGDSRSYKLKDFPEEQFEYLYDFGDYWEHRIMVEKKMEGKNLTNPICLQGEGRCPPEDIGGTHGFKEFLESMKDKSHPERESYITWYGSEFDPDQVDLDQSNVELTNLDQYIHEIENAED